MKKPTPMPKGAIDLDCIIDQCKEYIQYMEDRVNKQNHEYHKDTIVVIEDSIFEVVMESVYGPEIWDYINSKTS